MRISAVTPYFSRRAMWLVSIVGMALVFLAIHLRKDEFSYEREIQPVSAIPDMVRKPEYHKRYSDEARSFSQDSPLKFQLPLLQKAFNHQDAYATCVLARALQLCQQQRLGKGPEFAYSSYANEYIASLSDKEMNALADALAASERTVSSSCNGLVDSDYEMLDDILYKSAQNGDPVSMREFALQNDKQTAFGVRVEASKQNIERHQKNAEKMLNSAAEAGDQVAIEALFWVYVTGMISTPLGDVKVQPDFAKAIAAYLALTAADEHRLKSTQSADEREQAKKFIDQQKDGLNHGDQIRLVKLQEAYIRAYRAKKRPDSIGEELINKLPEQACSENYSRS